VALKGQRRGHQSARGAPCAARLPQNGQRAAQGDARINVT